MRPPHCAGGVEAGGSKAGGSKATAMATSTSKEAAEADTADWSFVVGCIGYVTLIGGRPRWL